MCCQLNVKNAVCTNVLQNTTQFLQANRPNNAIHREMNVVSTSTTKHITVTLPLTLLAVSTNPGM